MNEKEFKRLYEGVFEPLINQEQFEILKHTQKVTHFCGGSKDMDDLVNKGLMQYAGKKSFVPDPYYKLTAEGRKLLRNMLPRADK